MSAVRRASRPRPPVVVGVAAAVAAVAALALAGCGQQFQAERDGRDLGRAVCDLRDAGDAEAAKAALDDVLSSLDRIADRYGAVTASDRAELRSGLQQVADDVTAGDLDAARADLESVRRSADGIQTQLGDASDAIWTGFTDEVGSCNG